MAYKRILQNNSYTSYVFTYNVKQLIIYLIVETDIKKIVEPPYLTPYLTKSD